MTNSEDVQFKTERSVIPKAILDYKDYKYKHFPGRLKLLNARCCRRAKMCHSQIGSHPIDCYIECFEEKIQLKEELKECMRRNWPDSREKEKTE